MPLGKSYQEYRDAAAQRDPTLQDDLREAAVQLELGLALNRLRHIRGLSKRALAELTGIKQPMLVRIERGSQSPGIETIAKIVRRVSWRFTISLRLCPSATTLSGPLKRTAAGIL